MKRFGIAAALMMLILALAPAVDATTTWTARPAGHGTASLRVGSPSRFVLGLTGFRPGTAWTVSLRRGSCATLGSLVTSLRVTASSTGRLARTVTLTTAQTRLAARLPLALRFGSSCAKLAAPVAVIPAPTPTPSPSPSPSPTPEPGAFGDGMWRVGVNVQPGTYATVGTSSCYWARLSGFGGTLDEIIANNFGSGSQIVTIAPTDAGFTSSGCGTWRLQTGMPAPTPTAAPCGVPYICMGQAVGFGPLQVVTVNRVTAWPDGLVLNPEPSGWTLVSVWVTMTWAYAPAPTLAIRGPSGTLYGPVEFPQSPALDTAPFVGTDTGYVTFAVPAAEYGRLFLTIDHSTSVRLY